ncbi:MAG: helix-turn-helix domain-containing protein [Chloroflexi bacterium]|nr:helix-turn-helix domain-containing protein [Chloroflexota bacterium]
MSHHRVGRAIRALRHRLSWRQQDLADRARLSQDAVSRVERGLIDGMTVDKLQRIVDAVDGELVLLVRWRGGELDRLLDAGHAHLVAWTASLLTRLGWQPELEVSFSVFGERGSIDVLAWHPPSRTLLVVEVKTELVSVEETLRRHDVKTRLGAQISEARFEWRPTVVGRVLVLPGTATARRRVNHQGVVFERAYPVRSWELRSWLRRPTEPVRGLLFVPPTHLTRGKRGPTGSLARRRIRHARTFDVPPRIRPDPGDGALYDAPGA